MNQMKSNFLSVAKYFLFFFYFSGIYHLLCIGFKVSNTIGLRESFYMSFLWLGIVFLFSTKAKKVAAILGLFLWIGSLFSLGYFAIYKQEFSQSVIFIIFESNLAESSEFLETYFVWWIIPMFLIYSAGAFYLWKILDNSINISFSKKVVFMLLFLAIPFHKFIDLYFVKNKDLVSTSFEQMKRMQTSSPWNLIFSYVNYRIDLVNMENLINENANLEPLKNLEDKYKDKATTLVLVIGESTNRNRMSLYGYDRNTTPRLDKIKDDLTVFDNVYSPRPYTIEVLQQALTFADEENPDLYLSKPNLINMMKQAGYETYWITNQQTQTKRNTMLTTFSQICDHQVYLNNNRKQNGSASYDEQVIKPFEEVLNTVENKKRFIVVHLLGTHNKYKYRYPEEFAKFDNKNVHRDLNEREKMLYNEYDNAVYYNDYVVSSLIDIVKKEDKSTALLYFSDHGEEVFDEPLIKKLGRNENTPTQAMYTVPFIIYENSKWKEEIGNNFSRNVTHRLYSSSNLIYTFSDLAGINYDSFDSSKSIINSDYIKYSVFIGDPSDKKRLRDLTKIPFKEES